MIICFKRFFLPTKPLQFSAVLFSSLFLYPDLAFCESTHALAGLGEILPMWSVIPFAGILLSIALFPLLAPHFWHDHYGKTAAFWAILFALPFIYFFKEAAVYQIVHIFVIDYLPFIILLWGLFTIAGGIAITGKLRGTPLINTAMLLTGTLLASWIGTTGASMVMIRPVLRANLDRVKKVHIICFFIFLVSNVGGALSPLGDPPLFLGFLHNVPFFWVTKAVLPHTLLSTFVLIITFFLIDKHYYRKEAGRIRTETQIPGDSNIAIQGMSNIILLAFVVLLVLLSGSFNLGGMNLMGIELQFQNVLRDLGIIALGLFSLHITPKQNREMNEFSWTPIVEVAKLFAAIFITIIPAILILKAGDRGALAGLLSSISRPSHYFWVSGGLSSFLDNAPTYLTFFNMGLGKLGIEEAAVAAACTLNNPLCNQEWIGILTAVSAGSVFMGANTYIGNAPNFMVKSIAEEAGVNMPSFFGYIFKYSLPFLIPVFILNTLLFF